MNERNLNTTREYVIVKVGQVWRDLDKRMNGRCCKIIAVHSGMATMANCSPNGDWPSSRHTHTLIRRMHKSSTGWALVLDAP